MSCWPSATPDAGRLSPTNSATHGCSSLTSVTWPVPVRLQFARSNSAASTSWSTTPAPLLTPEWTPSTASNRTSASTYSDRSCSRTWSWTTSAAESSSSAHWPTGWVRSTSTTPTSSSGSGPSQPPTTNQSWVICSGLPSSRAACRLLASPSTCSSRIPDGRPPTWATPCRIAPSPRLSTR